MTAIDATHDPALRSWVDSANDPESDFPIQNLPWGVFRDRGRQGRIGIAIGDRIIDMAAAVQDGALGDDVAISTLSPYLGDATLNRVAGSGRAALRAMRAILSRLLRIDDGHGRTALARHLLPQADVEMLLPLAIGDYTDFYASLAHATNVGSMFRPDNPLLPNYKHIPIGYHGRASSVVVSGTPIRRPSGQTKDDGSAAPTFGPTRRLDYELEVGAFVGRGNALGSPIPIDEAEEHLMGLCLVNDWSARDIQAWEYQPLGPFLAKSFATTVSPWIVTLDALAPFRAPAFSRARGDPQPLPYLRSAPDADQGGIDLQLEVQLRSSTMRSRGDGFVSVSRSHFSGMYWTLAQMMTHHASNGCNLRSGDLIASGTVSGDAADARGCLLELTWRGSRPLHLPTGEERRFLEDGDEVRFIGWCERPGVRRIGFGTCDGIVVPAL